MFLDKLGHMRWEKQDFSKHGTIAMYLIGECRCEPCTENILKPDLDKPLPARYHSG